MTDTITISVSGKFFRVPAILDRWKQLGYSCSAKVCEAIEEKEEVMQEGEKITKWLNRDVQRALDNNLPKINEPITVDFLRNMAREDVIRLRRVMDKNMETINQYTRKMPYHFVHISEKDLLRQELNEWEKENNSRMNVNNSKGWDSVGGDREV